MRAKVTASLADRFWRHVTQFDACWLWTGRTKSDGYGVLDKPRGCDGYSRPLLAHRISWELHVGPIPDGMFVCHRCDNPPCVRPDHLFLGTNADNIADAVAKGRQARGEAKHMKLTEPDVREIRRLWAAGGLMQKQIATMFGVGRSVISEVVSRKSWAHVID